MNNDVPQHVRPYVEAIGTRAAVEFLLSFGGTIAYLSMRPTKDCDIVQAIGEPATIQLAREIGRGHIRIPIANRWLARQLYAQGWSRRRIAVRLRVKIDTVRDFLRGAEMDADQPDPRALQLDLFRK